MPVLVLPTGVGAAAGADGSIAMSSSASSDDDS